MLAGAAVVVVVGAVLAVFLLGTAFRDLIVLDRDLLGRVDVESADTIVLDEGEHVLVAVGHDMVHGDTTRRPLPPPLRLTSPNGDEVPIRPPGFDSRTTTGEQRIVIADFTVTTAGPHRLDVGQPSTPGLDALAIARKASVSPVRIGGGIVGVGLFVIGGLGVLIAGIIAILAHRDVRRAGPGA